MKNNESSIIYTNAKFLEVDLEESYQEAGKKIAQKLIDKYGKKKKYVFVCGLGGNSGDGLATALSLYKEGVSDISVYLVGRQTQFEDPVTEKFWNKIYELRENITVKQDCYADDIPQGEVVIESLVGTGLEGEILNKRFHDVINRISHFHCPLVAIDIPAPHYSPDKVYSLIHPKTENAEVISLKLPQDLKLYCGPGEVKCLFQPNKKTHKKKNGKLLIITDTQNGKELKKIINSASQYLVRIDLFNLTNLPQKFYEDIKYKNFSIVETNNFEDVILEADSILIYKLDQVNILNKSFLKFILDKYQNLKYIFADNSLQAVDINDLENLENILLIQNQNDLNKSLNTITEKGSVKGLAVKKNWNILHLGSQVTTYNNSGDFRIERNNLIVQDYYKPLLTGIISAFSTKNSFWLSTRAGVATITLASRLALNDVSQNKLSSSIISKNITTIIDWCQNF